MFRAFMILFAVNSLHCKALGQDVRAAGEILRGMKDLQAWNVLGNDGGRCRIRTYDFHRVKVTLYR